MKILISGYLILLTSLWLWRGLKKLKNKYTDLVGNYFSFSPIFSFKTLLSLYFGKVVKVEGKIVEKKVSNQVNYYCFSIAYFDVFSNLYSRVAIYDKKNLPLKQGYELCLSKMGVIDSTTVQSSTFGGLIRYLMWYIFYLFHSAISLVYLIVAISIIGTAIYLFFSAVLFFFKY